MRRRRSRADGTPARLIEMLPPLHAALRGGDNARPRTGLLERALRLGHLDLLEAIRDENCHFLSCERFVIHVILR